jgi:hypothetical protein
VRGFREVATALAFATAVEPPPALRARVMSAVARTRQFQPEAQPASHKAQPVRRAAPWLTGLAAAAAIVLAVVFGVAQAHTSQQLSQARAQNQAIAAVLAAPDARLITAGTTAGGRAAVVVDAATHRLIVTTSDLPALPAGRVYQLWLIGQATTVSAGLLPAAAVGGQTAPVLASDLLPGDKLGLTVEPAPGSVHPTTTPILALPI